jgi:hypothetical protein
VLSANITGAILPFAARGKYPFPFFIAIYDLSPGACAVALTERSKVNIITVKQRARYIFNNY